QNTDCTSLAHHGHREDCSEPTKSFGIVERVVGIELYVGNMNRPSFEERTSGGGSSLRFDRQIFHQISGLVRKTIDPGASQRRSPLYRDSALVRITKSVSGFHQRLQHGL